MKRSIFWTYCAWSILLFMHGFTKFTDGRFAELAGESYEWFLAIYLAVQMAQIGIGGILCWLADDQAHKWASWCFVAYCVWRAIDSIWGSIRFSSDDSGLNWLYLVVFPFGWLVLTTLELLRQFRGEAKQRGQAPNEPE